MPIESAPKSDFDTKACVARLEKCGDHPHSNNVRANLAAECYTRLVDLEQDVVDAEAETERSKA